MINVLPARFSCKNEKPGCAGLHDPVPDQLFGGSLQ
jgi:hypothetical protein